MMIFWVWRRKQNKKKNKNKQVGLYQTKKILYDKPSTKSKGNLLRENICKSHIQKEVNIQNV